MLTSFHRCLLVLCEGNPPITGGFLHKGPVMWSFGYFCKRTQIHWTISRFTSDLDAMTVIAKSSPIQSYQPKISTISYTNDAGIPQIYLEYCWIFSSADFKQYFNILMYDQRPHEVTIHECHSSCIFWIPYVFKMCLDLSLEATTGHYEYRVPMCCSNIQKSLLKRSQARRLFESRVYGMHYLKADTSSHHLWEIVQIFGILQCKVSLIAPKPQPLATYSGS